jgi:CubicO group peptidase (beta-lactamase class C family)
MAGWRAPDGGPTLFGDLLSPTAFGHGGATGTVVWADPDRDLICILFTTEPARFSNGLLGRISNVVAAAAR